MKNFKNALAVIGGENLDQNPIMIVSDENGISTNAEAIKKVIDKADEAKELLISKGTLEQIESGEKELKKVYKWLKDSRIEKTKVLDDIKKEFTKNENDLQSIIKEISDTKAILLESEYQKAEKNIKDYGWTVIDEYAKDEIELDITLLDHFIALKRALKGYRGDKLSKAHKDEIKAVFDAVADKIKEEREGKKKRDADIMQFNTMLNFHNTVEELEELRDTISDLYPSIYMFAESSINAKIAKVKKAQNRSEQNKKEEIKEEIKKDHDDKIQSFFKGGEETETYKIHDLDMMVIAGLRVEAMSREEATKKMINEVEKILSMSEVVKDA